MKIWMFLLCCLIASGASAQQRTYTVQQAHSHNDYEQKRPFGLAYDNGFGSIEADVFLVNGTLPVAHNARDIRPDRDLKSLYLDPIKACIRKNNGTVYADRSKKLQLLIDCKTEGVATLNAIISTLKRYPEITGNKTVRIVITGNRPNKDSLIYYPSFIWFDGELTNIYTRKNLARVALFSANFKNYSAWNGTGNLDSASKVTLEVAIQVARKAGTPIRFWGAPDNKEAWEMFRKLGVGYINTDRIAELATFLKGPEQLPR
ncbi:phosphatidylinositol-specific phospholipase C/glycerophosphodiester phosphodiesterase family protein [Niabella sp. CC-SYL272]|uniref:phosphatidylinositol-specific phospholipase C/glycerophosphodiester phosphodiesterase family protein n=1 Tax=Niabella agricola TaxID=2891571 RepID=UPI001F4061BB|nr:phosphatidylinositol-specific phospholipase C/glycerophosphodiester phosphodiesterase family protein [Niabella agricola]MCF3109039.1 phosphatidylinositol-specific phospholipase C/glycerophosphodiester phosphodiesterase family protein [Niabella agricola]